MTGTGTTGTRTTGTEVGTDTVTGTGGTVYARVTGGVADVRLNRPEKLNALNSALFGDLLEVGLLLRDRADLRAVVLSGEGRGFCAGLDFASFGRMAEGGRDWREPDLPRPCLLAPEDPLTPLNRGQRAVRVWGTAGVPVIAAVHGPAFGGGLQLALGADIRIVAPDAKLCVAEVNWGLVPDMGGSQLLPRMVGDDVAMELTLAGSVITGAEADRIGMATRTAGDPRAAALELATDIAARSPDAVRAARALLVSSRELSLEDGLAAERQAMANVAGGPNQREAVRARLEKRPAAFTDSPEP
ncbi:MAG TPA: crotonase/enoyl-CoA hydratase family protein [Pseudonocardia sp.]|jgi:enoyl-CoA hydratase/carnithine racemase